MLPRPCFGTSHQTPPLNAHHFCCLPRAGGSCSRTMCHCPDPRQKEGVTFWARVGRAVELAIRIQPSGECNPAHSHPPGPRIASRFTCVALIYGAPAQRLSTVLRARRSRSEWPKLIYIALAMRIGADFVCFGTACYFRLCSVCRVLREICWLGTPCVRC